MAYRIDCDCDSCESVRDDAFVDFSELVGSVLDYHGVEPGPVSEDKGDVVSHLATEMMVAAGLLEDVEPHTPEQAELADVRIFGNEIDMEYRRLFRSGENVVPFRRRGAR